MICLRWQLAELLRASVEPCLLTFNAFLKACAWRRAFVAIQKPVMKLDVVSYSTLMSSSPWPRGMQVLQMTPCRGVRPNLVMRNAALAFQQNWRLPLCLLRGMQEMDDFTMNTAPRPRSATLTHLLDLCITYINLIIYIESIWGLYRVYRALVELLGWPSPIGSSEVLGNLSRPGLWQAAAELLSALRLQGHRHRSVRNSSKFLKILLK